MQFLSQKMTMTVFAASVLPIMAQEKVEVFSSLERYNYQTGDASLSVRSYDGFDDIGGTSIEEDSFNGVGEYYAININGGGDQQIPYSQFYQQYKRGVEYATSAAMLAARPIDATYTHVLQTADEGRIEFEITAPNVSLADGIPVDPLFTISGVSGTWTSGNNGIGRFEFDPMSVAEFTITLNAYVAPTGVGTHYTSQVQVNSIGNGFSEVDTTSSGLLASSVDPSGLSPLVLTFKRGLADDAEDGDPTTFGYQDGSVFELEGEHVNAWLETGPGSIGDYDFELTKGFVMQTVTGMEIAAVASIPEPSTSALLILGIGGRLMRRRR
ncbi:PEP-CTERM sorting domain-containing protein [Rubritalea tangerina]|uniref:PEP-CTERM sorting domain-containing protein n=1 Tax=Rubritalea tangerina TaxID=430798 RepID=A0ABW4Z8T4_9BACT